MNPKHQEKVAELIDSLASRMKETAERLYKSGGINPEGFDENYYPLAKVLVTAAIRQHANDFYPKNNAYLRFCIKNLSHF
jgi:hypothetical protein